MHYDKSHIPAIADDVVNGRIDESTAISLFPEDLQRILRVEIIKRLRSRGYDRNNIGETTEKGIPYLADDIVLGRVKEDDALNALFIYDVPILKKELVFRREDEVLWNQALASQTIEMLEKYLDTYNNPDSTYVGRYVSRAEEYINHIANDDKAWAEAKRLDTEEAYLKYLDNYDKPAPSYRGKYIKDVKEAIVKLKDNKDWEKACEINSLQSYSDYLSMYDRVTPDYAGIHVEQAHSAIANINDDADWAYALNLNTTDSYMSYLEKYDVQLPTYRGKYIDDAKQRIASLTPPPAPNPRIKDDEAWNNATKLNTKAAYEEYLTQYGQASSEGYIGAHVQEAEWAIRHIIDEDAWAKAKSLNTIESYQEYKDTCDANKYPGYNWAHYNAANANIGNLRKAEDARAQKEKDNSDWACAQRDNTIEAYKHYLNLHNSGIHKKEVLDAIAKLEKRAFIDQENIDWQSACKWLFVLLAIIAIAAFLIYQRKCHGWPFGQRTITPPITIVEEVDSLQWAIDNHNIPLLTRYAEMDSIRAYYPLAWELNAQDSVANVEKTLHWLDLVLDPDVNSLHQNIINDIQEKELDELVLRFNAINPNEKDADRKYLDIYKDYVRHFERLATHTPRIRVQCMPIEDMANAQIADRKKHEELRTSILREWETQQSRLRTILSNIDDNAKKAYSNNQ